MKGETAVLFVPDLRGYCTGNLSFDHLTQDRIDLAVLWLVISQPQTFAEH